MSDDAYTLDFLDEAAPFDERAFEVALEPKQLVFVAEYLLDMDAGKASLRAGVSPDTGKKWVRNPLIAARIRVALQQRLSRTKFSSDRVLQETSLLALSRVDHYLVDDEGNVVLSPAAPFGAMAAVQSIKRRITTRTDPKTGETVREVNVELKLWDKPAPLKLMGRHVGLFPDRMEHTGPNGGPIETVTKIERVIVDPEAVQS